MAGNIGPDDLMEPEGNICDYPVGDCALRGLFPASDPTPSPSALLEAIREIRTAAYGNSHMCAEQNRIFDMAQAILRQYE
jgi:hypothetical protein